MNPTDLLQVFLCLLFFFFFKVNPWHHTLHWLHHFGSTAYLAVRTLPSRYLTSSHTSPPLVLLFLFPSTFPIASYWVLIPVTQALRYLSIFISLCRGHLRDQEIFLWCCLYGDGSCDPGVCLEVMWICFHFYDFRWGIRWKYFGGL